MDHDFQKEAGGNVYYLRHGPIQFPVEEIVRFDYHSPDLTGWTWEEQIRQSGVCRFCNQNLAGLHFETGNPGPSIRINRTFDPVKIDKSI